MIENEMKLDDPATRRDLKNHPTNAQLDASLRQVMLHIDSTFAQVMLHVDSTVAQHANAILEGVRDTIRGLDDRYRDLPARVTKLEATVFSPPPKRKRKAG